MKHCLLVGKPNVGKTSFFLNFASYLGVYKCELTFKDAEGRIIHKEYSIELAKKYLISQTPFKTKDICEINLSIPIYKGFQSFKLLDSSGLIDGISDNEDIRSSMTATIKALEETNIILHIIDASSIFMREINSISLIDDQINRYCKSKSSYCILSNKMDLEGSKKGYELLKNKYYDSYIIPISSVSGIGFKEVRMFVGRNL